MSNAPSHVIVRRRATWAGLGLRELWRYRDVFVALGARDVKLRYRQTALGIIWVVLQPLIAAALFAFVFGRVARLPSDGVPYFLFAFTSFVAWTSFQSTFTRASLSLVQNAPLVSKIFFPRLLLPLASAVSALLDFSIGLALLAVLLPAYGIIPGAGMLLLPVWILLVQLLALGLGFFAAALVVSYRDVEHALPVLIPFMMFASPVAYGLSAVPEAWRKVFEWNPLTGLLEAFRWSVLHGTGLDWSVTAYSALAAVVTFLAGAFAFKRMERRFADVI